MMGMGIQVLEIRLSSKAGSVTKKKKTREKRRRRSAGSAARRLGVYRCIPKAVNVEFTEEMVRDGIDECNYSPSEKVQL